MRDQVGGGDTPQKGQLCNENNDSWTGSSHTLSKWPSQPPNPTRPRASAQSESGAGGRPGGPDGGGAGGDRDRWSLSGPSGVGGHTRTDDSDSGLARIFWRVDSSRFGTKSSTKMTFLKTHRLVPYSNTSLRVCGGREEEACQHENPASPALEWPAGDFSTSQPFLRRRQARELTSGDALRGEEAGSRGQPSKASGPLCF